MAPSDHRPASAVVVVRPGPDGSPELMFVKRPSAMRFLAGFHAFAGGALHPEDSAPECKARAGITDADAARLLGDAAGGLDPVAFFVCAIRELFEETGLLLGEGAFDTRTIAAARAKLAEMPFDEVIESCDLRLGASKLRFHQRWVAPEVLPVRFDLRVFVASLDDLSGTIEPDPSEVGRVDWFSASEVRALSELDQVMMAPPTSATVDSLGRYATVSDLMDDVSEQRAPRDPEIHSATVRRLLAPNASLMTGPGTNSYIVGTGPYVVIDPGSMEPEHLDVLAAAGEIGTIVITHGHSDHLAGALDLAQMTAAEMAASEVFWERSKLSKQGRRLSHGDVIEVGGVALEVLETPGHSSDHICLWHRAEASLFCGDLLMGEGTAVISPPDGNLTDYLESLQMVLDLQPETLYPGHFPPRSGASAWIAWYIEHRRDREEQILSALQQGAKTPAEIVTLVYKDVPKALHPIAERSVMAHLEKLGRT